MVEGGHFTIGDVTRSHIGDQNFPIGRFVRRSFSTTLGPSKVIKL